MLWWLLAAAVLVALIGVVYLRWYWRAPLPAEAPWPIPDAKQHVIVLAHGLLGFDQFQVGGATHHYFRGIAEHLHSHGAVVQTSRVAPLGSVPERAAALVQFLEEIDERRIIIIGHSMGGLDARYALSKLGANAHVSALVTVGTPHHGSVLADAASSLPARTLLSLLGQVGVTTDALNWLGEEQAKEFDNATPNASDVYYGSVIGKTRRSQVLTIPLLLATYEILSRMRGDNDGMVPTPSQQWGEVLQRVETHHFGEIGWSPRFDANDMYLQLLHSLQNRGFACLPSHQRAAI